MKESYGEGIANHTGSESCGHGRKARREALTGETGRISREIPQTPRRRRLDTRRKDTSGNSVARAVPESCAVFDPGTRGHILRGSWEIPGSSEHTDSGRIGRSKDTSR